MDCRSPRNDRDITLPSLRDCEAGVAIYGEPQWLTGNGSEYRGLPRPQAGSQ